MNINIYKMNLHDVIVLDASTVVRRVPGGWIYVETMLAKNCYGKNTTNSTSTFVAWVNEFQEQFG